MRASRHRAAIWDSRVPNVVFVLMVAALAVEIALPNRTASSRALELEPSTSAIETWYAPYSDSYAASTASNTAPCNGYSVYNASGSASTGDVVGNQDTAALRADFCSTNQGETSEGAGFHQSEFRFSGSSGTYTIWAEWTYTLNITEFMDGCLSSPPVALGDAQDWVTETIAVWDETSGSNILAGSFQETSVSTYYSYCYEIAAGYNDQIVATIVTDYLTSVSDSVYLTNGDSYQTRSAFTVTSLDTCDYSYTCTIAESNVNSCPNQQAYCNYVATLDWVEIT